MGVGKSAITSFIMSPATAAPGVHFGLYYVHEILRDIECELVSARDWKFSLQSLGVTYPWRSFGPNVLGEVFENWGAASCIGVKLLKLQLLTVVEEIYELRCKELDVILRGVLDHDVKYAVVAWFIVIGLSPILRAVVKMLPYSWRAWVDVTIKVSDYIIVVRCLGLNEPDILNTLN